MAIITRYFSTTSAGAADGTSWANRAALVSGAAFSTVITGFAFNGSDSLRCLVGPGSYSAVITTLQSSSFTNPPTIANPLEFHGCDSSGNPLTPPDPDWTSDQPAWDDSGLPVLTSSTNDVILSLGNCYCRLMKFTSTGVTNRGIIGCSLFDWCSFIGSTSNTAAFLNSSMYNSLISITSTNYVSALDISVDAQIVNCRFVGVTGSSGLRHCVTTGGSSNNISCRLTGCTIVGFGGSGFADITTTTVSRQTFITSCNFIGNGGSGILFSTTASQAGVRFVNDCYIVNNGAYGVNAESSRVILTNTRLRDNTSGNLNSFGNQSIDRDIETTDSDDASELVNAAGGDYRIKAGSAIHGKGYGVSDQASGGGGPLVGPGRLIRA